MALETILTREVLKEHIGPQRMAGVVLILCGVALVAPVTLYRSRTIASGMIANVTPNNTQDAGFPMFNVYPSPMRFCTKSEESARL